MERDADLAPLLGVAELQAVRRSFGRFAGVRTVQRSFRRFAEAFGAQPMFRQPRLIHTVLAGTVLNGPDDPGSPPPCGGAA